MTEIDHLNKWLKETYGHDLLGRPTLRLVLSSTQLEKRKGTIAEFYGPIFIREWYGIHEVPKYSDPSWRDRWMLERLTFDIPNPELCLDVAGTYEPIWCFRGPNGSYQRPNLKSLRFLLSMWEQQMVTAQHTPLRQDDWNRMEKREFQEEVDYFYGALQDTYGDEVATALHYGEAVAPGCLYGPDGTVTSRYNKPIKAEGKVVTA